MKFKHDCTNCQPLGEFKNHDLYYCDQPIGESTVIARFSSHGPDYSSGMMFAREDGNLFLYEAKLRAIKKGYIK